MTSLSTSALLQPSETRHTLRVAGNGSDEATEAEREGRRERRTEWERLKGRRG